MITNNNDAHPELPVKSDLAELDDLFWLVLVVALAVGWWADRTLQETKHAKETAANQDVINTLRV